MRLAQRLVCAVLLLAAWVSCLEQRDVSSAADVGPQSLRERLEVRGGT